MQQPQLLNVETSEGVLRVTLNRPEVRNAFNSQLIEELLTTFQGIADGTPGGIRAVVLSGAGQSFCAGADVNWMRASLDFTHEQNVEDATHMADMFDQINSCPVPVIGRIHGAALGGGVGLAAVCDIVVAAEDVVWAFSEAKLGIAPAVISPYVLAKIGRSHARALFFTAERFDSRRAWQIGLAHVIVPASQLDVEVDRLLLEIKSSSAQAIARAKQLISAMPALAPLEAKERTVQAIAALRVSSDGQEGLRAFLEKRKPEWAG